MADTVYNFGAGPAMLPPPVMEKIQQEWLNFQGMGVSLIEISHRSKEFVAVLGEAQTLFRQLTGLPENYRILFVHGGARMQFSALPLNFANCAESKNVSMLTVVISLSLQRKRHRFLRQPKL